ncbi:MAG: helix-turn-helix domain-containing protein [Frankiaceae bacterium]|nr:helix-turn-helix domain-containing protein [Frankiaceae bacterium]
MTTSFDPTEAAAVRAAAPLSQTLDRGLQVLELLAEREQPLSSVQIAAALGVHRSIAYRIVRTLEDHRLVQRRSDGRWEPGVGLVVLARSVSPTLHRAATPELADLANDLGMTAFLAVADRDECVTVLTVEPRHSQVHVAYRPGRRHAIDRGGPGVALLAGGPPRPGERPEVTAAREAGYTLTSGEVVPGLSSVAAPVVTQDGWVVASVAVLFLQEPPRDVEPVALRVCRAARAIARELQ